MRTWKRYLPLINCCLAVIALGLGVLAVHYLWGRQGYPTSKQVYEHDYNSQEGKTALDARWGDKRLDAYKDIWARNIFDPQRRDWPEERASNDRSSEKKTDTKNNIQLGLVKKVKVVGIVIENSRAKALINRVGKGKSRKFLYIRPGDMIAGCQVKSIERERVVLDCAGEKVEKFIQGRGGQGGVVLAEVVQSQDSLGPARKRISSVGGRSKKQKGKGLASKAQGLVKKKRKKRDKSSKKHRPRASSFKTIQDLFELMKSIEEKGHR